MYHNNLKWNQMNQEYVFVLNVIPMFHLKFIRKKRGYVNVSCVCGYEKELNIKDYLTILKQNTKRMTFKTKCVYEYV